MKAKLISISALACAIVIGFGVLLLTRAKSTQPNDKVIINDKSKEKVPVQEQNITELKSVDTVIGTGAEAVSGKKITVHYTGKLLNGTKFDSSVDRGQPFSFNLGAGEVIKGWDQGFAGMKVGGKRTLTIPSNLAYGASGQGSIPPNSPLIFDVELLGVE